MTFGEKLAALTKGRSKAELSREAGLPPNAISDYINKAYLPRVDTALALAKVLEVSVDWLADDEKDFPPMKSAATAEAALLSDEEIMVEAARRYRLEVLRVRSIVHAIRDTDWSDVAKQLYEIPMDRQLPADLLGKVRGLQENIMRLHASREAYNPRVWAEVCDPAMPGGNLKPEEVNVGVVLDEFFGWMRDNPFLSATLTNPRMGMQSAWPDWPVKIPPEKIDAAERARREGLEKLRALGESPRAEITEQDAPARRRRR